MSQLKVYLVNDCFEWFPNVHHYGGRAVIDSLKLRIQKAGHEIVAVEKRPFGPVRENIEKCDIVIINGEGTFRDESSNYEPGRHDRMFDGINLALDMDKEVYLTNAVWCQMSDRWREPLMRMSGISVREPESANQIEALTGMRPEIHPDEAYFLPVQKNVPVTRNGLLIGNFYENVPDIRDGWEPRSYCAHAGLLNVPWGLLVLSLQSFECYVTGQHHGVYAACKARCPFAACRVNTHKLSSLFGWAGVNIPLASSIKEVFAAIRYAETNHAEFDKLFDFLEKQTPWPIPGT